MSSEKMKDLVQRGQVTRMHELSPDGLEWRKAEEFEELYPPKAKPVERRASKSDQEQQVVAEEVKPPAEWYAHVNDEQQGPLDEATLRQWIKKRQISRETLIWRIGMQEWVAAGSLFPQYFGQAAAVSLGKASDDQTAEQTATVVDELRYGTTWVYVLSITCIVISSLLVIFAIFVVVTQIMAPAESGGEAIIGLLFPLTFLAMTILAFIASLSLLQYANILTSLKYSPTDENLQRALHKLSSFWRFAGIWVLSVLIFFALNVLLWYAAGVRFFYFSRA